YHFDRGLPVRRYRLLANHGNSRGSRQPYDRQMRFCARRDVKEIQLLSIQHLLGGDIGPRRGFTGPLELEVASGHDLRFGNPTPGFKMMLGEVAASDDSSSQDAYHVVSSPNRWAGFACIMQRTSSTANPLAQSRSAYCRMPSTGGGVSG